MQAEGQVVTQSKASWAADITFCGSSQRSEELIPMFGREISERILIRMRGMRAHHHRAPRTKAFTIAKL
jgi:hypothetical protein